MAVLDKIEQANDIKSLTDEELEVLPGEIRRFLIEHIAKTGGHLASNLGVVELTMALHLVMHFPEDKIIWDVGHQSYTHKILTGRKEGFANLRRYGGMSGFPKRAESDCDAFDTGHSSTSLAAGIGFVYAREQRREHFKVVTVIGDGSMTGGLALSALNSAGTLKSNYVVVLNDNNMSIGENVGAMARRLSGVRTSENYSELKNSITNSLEKIPGIGKYIVSGIRRTKSGIKQLLVPGMLFEEMGFLYLGPVDGHDVKTLTEVLRQALRYKGPVLVHVRTVKGKGYLPAERHPETFHGTDAFCVETGKPLKEKNRGYGDVFSSVICRLAKTDRRIVAITAAMADGTGLKRFQKLYPERFFDVGIAEDYAVTLSASLAVNGFIPVVCVYSSFLQRGFDQLLHDVCLQKQHVIFIIDRAGLVGADGETHQGIFDLSYLLLIPNMIVMAPKNMWELSDMLRFAMEYDGPVAIRYPRGAAYDGLREFREPIRLGGCEVLGPVTSKCPEAVEAVGAVCGKEETYSTSAEDFRKDSESLSGIKSARILLFALGSMVKVGEQVLRELRQHGKEAILVNARFASPLDTAFLTEAAKGYDLIVTMEENVESGGFGMHVKSFLSDRGYRGQVLTVSLPDQFVPHGNVSILFQNAGLDASSVTKRILTVLRQTEDGGSSEALRKEGI